MTCNPLVSVIVITYNSATTIQETLDSVSKQNYDNIELIITDDCSSDETVIKCEEWLAKNKSRFRHLQLLTADTNQGVCKNLNKGMYAATGEWAKVLAGDDILLPNCIEDNMEYVSSHSNASFVFSYMKVYKDVFEEVNCIDTKKGPRNRDIFEEPANVQLIYMAYAAFVYIQTMFCKLNSFKEIGGFDTRYGYEDWPFFVDLLEKGYKCDLLDKVTAGYRVHSSLSHATNKLFNYSLTKKTIPFLTGRCFRYYTPRKKFAVRTQWLIEKVLYMTNLDNATPLMSYLYRKMTAVLFKFGNSSLKSLDRIKT